MQLPIKFQFRCKNAMAFTHTAKMNAHGDYEVQWARGWANVICAVPNVVFDSNLAKELIEEGSWQLVDDKPKQEEKLPDEFYFNTASGTNYKAVKRDGYYQVTWPGDDKGTTYGLNMSKDCVKTGAWKILDKRSLTAEQQKTVNTFREQIAQLDSSIRINNQTIEHHQRMIGNYKQRQNDLLEKIAEITGEDSPSVAKAKEMKAELAKLKKGNV